MALSAALIALLARWLLNPVLGDQAPFGLPILAVLVAATYGGLAPAALTIAVSVVGVTVLWLWPRVATGAPLEFVRIGVFVVIGLAMGWLAERMHRARCRALIEEQRRESAERQRAEDALRSSKQRLRIALEAARMGTWEWDMQANHVAWSAGLEALHGLEPGAFGGTFEAFQRDIHPDDRQGVLDTITHTLQHGGNEHHVEYRIIRPDGEVRWMEGRGTLTRDADGKPLRMLGVCMDITERKRVEHAAQEHEHRFARFTQHLPGLAWIKDVRGRYVYVNDAAAAAFQKSREELYGRTDDDIFPPEVAEQFRSNDLRALQDGSVQAIETLKHDDGVLHHSLVSKFAIPGRDGSAAWVGGMAIDITDRLRMEHALRESDRRKDEFLAVLAHELRNPLAPIRAAAQVMRAASARRSGAAAAAADPDARASEAQHQWALEVIERQARLMSRLVDDLMDVSRITRGKLELRRERVNIVEIVHRVMASLQPLIESRQHQVTLAQPPGPIHLNADAARLEQILGNLLNNAAKYTDTRGRIALSVSMQEQDQTVVVRVRDSGVGMDSDFLPHVFDMFAQGHAGREAGRRREGLGIGLALVRSLVEMHGGTITAHSDGLGKGSEFVVRLPTALELQHAAPAAGAGDNRDDDARAPLAIDIGVIDEAMDARRAPLIAAESPLCVAPSAPTMSNNSEPKAQSPVAARSSTIGAPRCILVVDDNVDVAQTLAVFLRLDAHEVHIAHDATAALEALQRHRPEIVFLDIGLPGMDGHELARRIRTLSPSRSQARPADGRADADLDAPLLVALTGWGQPDDRRRSREAGFDHHLVKPVEPEVLQSIVREPAKFRQYRAAAADPAPAATTPA